MAELATLARPYAEAVFDLAKETNSFDDWSSQLQLLTLMVTDPQLAEVINNPQVDKSVLTALLLDIGQAHLSAQGQNLVKILIDNHRLIAVSAIADEYERLRAQHQQYVHVEILSTYPLTESQQQNVATMLSQRLGKAVDISTRLDESLMGGWLIRAGDEVIDLSIHGRLHQLATELRS